MRCPTANRQDNLEVKMTPMIDVVFLLLVFFVWTSSFEIPEQDLPSSIAEVPDGTAEAIQDRPPVEPFDEVILRVFQQGGIVGVELNGQRLTNFEELTPRIRAILSLGVQPPIIVDPESDVTMDDVVRVYDAARLAGGDRVLFAVEPGSP